MFAHSFRLSTIFTSRVGSCVCARKWLQVGSEKQCRLRSLPNAHYTNRPWLGIRMHAASCQSDEKPANRLQAVQRSVLVQRRSFRHVDVNPLHILLLFTYVYIEKYGCNRTNSYTLHSTYLPDLMCFAFRSMCGRVERHRKLYLACMRPLRARSTDNADVHATLGCPESREMRHLWKFPSLAPRISRFGGHESGHAPALPLGAGINNPSV